VLLPDLSPANSLGGNPDQHVCAIRADLKRSPGSDSLLHHQLDRLNQFDRFLKALQKIGNFFQHFCSSKIQKKISIASGFSPSLQKE
jgi:hypothetical protein